MKNKTDSSASLKEAILLLELKHAEEKRLLTEHLVIVYEKLKPGNLIKSTFDELTSALENRKSLINRLFGTLTGYLIQKIVIGSKPGLLKKFGGVLLNYGVAAFISRYAESIKILGIQLLNQIFDLKSIEDIKSVPENKE